MWLSAINRDLPKYKNTTLSLTGDQGQAAVEVGLAKVVGMEEGQYVIHDAEENEFLLFHPEVDVSEINVPCELASWQDPTTNEWMWAVAKSSGESSFQLTGKHHVEPEPH
jgi:hypothetical protein